MVAPNFSDIRTTEQKLRALDRMPARIAVAYAVIGSLWILVSDIVLGWVLTESGQTPVVAQIIKGLVFVAVTAVALYLVVAYLTRRASRATRSMIQAGRTRDRLAAIVDAAPDLIGTADLDGRLHYVNGAGRALMGIKPDAPLTDMHISRFHPPEMTRFFVETAFPTAVRQGRWCGEARLIDGDGASRPVSQTILVHRDENGDPTFFSTIMQDLTDRKHTEERMRMLQKLELLGQLTGGVAHDFNNLLVVMIGNAEALKPRLADDPNAARLADMILHAGERGTELTHRLLSFTRRQSLKPEPADLNRLVSASRSLIEQVLTRRNKVVIDLGAASWTVSVDTGEFETCLLNLAINARDAMAERAAEGGTVTIATRNVVLARKDVQDQPGARPGTYVKVTVTDTGIGMSPETAARAFEPFFTTKAPGKGTGLGLSMVVGFATHSGGHAAIDSEPGAGTAVSLYLPRLDCAQAAATLSSQFSSEKADNPAQ